MNPINRKRAKKKHAEAFGPPGFVEFVHEFGCVIAREKADAKCDGPVEVAHLKSRGAGGVWRENTVGLCRHHHAQHHRLGVESFDRFYETDLDLWACAITHRWDMGELT